MTAIETFPTMHDVLVGGDNLLNVTAGSAIKAGQIVSMSADGMVDVDTGSAPVLGVALYDAAANGPIAVASIGCRVEVANADGATAINAGTVVVPATLGGVAAAVLTSGGGTQYIAGVAVETIAGGSTGEIIVMPNVVSIV